jgi:ribose transport system substrate-binding protein
MVPVVLRKAVLALAACLALAAGVAACGGSSDTSGSGTESNSTTETESSGGGSAAAKEVVAPFVGQPSPFPVTEKLKEIPKGADLQVVDSGTPFASLLYQIESGAAATLGVNINRINAGNAANEVANAFDTVVAKEPDAVIVNGIDVKLWSKQLKELQEAEIPVVAGGVLEGEKYGLEVVQSGTIEDERAGELMANYVVGEMNPHANAVIYEVPEVPLTRLIAQKFSEELETICPECSVRTVPIPVSQLGNTAPNTVVSDLQANPETTVAVFTTEDIQLGLPQALKAAGVEVETLGFAPEPTNLEYLKEGKGTATLAYDVAVLAWTQVDQAVREIVGQKPTGEEAEGLGVIEFLKPEDITFDASKGYSGYPDVAERFAKLWGVGG